jgi:beta-propeller uncharacterized protein DUF5122
VARSRWWRTRLMACCFLAVPALSAVHLPVANAVAQGSLSAQISPSWQANATVWKMAYASGDVYLIGDFTSLRPPGDKAGTGEVSAPYFAALNASTGKLDTAFATHTFTGQPDGDQPLTDGAVAASPDGSVVYVGGAFTKVDGKTRSHIAAFNATTGALLPWQPAIDGRVYSIAQSGNTVYVGGTFTTAAGNAVSNIAALDATTGAFIPWGTPQVSTDDLVDAIAVSADGSQVVIGGYFDTVDGLSQEADGPTTYNKAAIIGGVDSDSPGVLEPMPADSVVPVTVGPPDTPKACDSNVKDAVISNGVVYFADEGTGIDCFDGTWAANLSDGSLKWVNRCLGATQTVAVVGDFLYKGSHIHDCQTDNPNGDPNNFPQVPAGHNRHATSEYLSNGWLGPWYPDVNAGPNLGPRTMATDGKQLYVGGDFTVINGIHQQGIARFTATNGYPVPRPRAPTVTSTQTGVVTVTAIPPVDLDNPDLTLKLYRSGRSTPVATANVESLFWRQPAVHWVVRGLNPNTHPKFRVRAVERHGATSPATSSILSPASQVKVACARPSPVRAAIVKVGVKRGGHPKLRQVRITVCAASALSAVFEVKRGHHVISHTREHYRGAGNHKATLAIKNTVKGGSVRAYVIFSRASHHRVDHRTVYLPR